ncbi:MAG TPA: MtrB/PioB family outer membrane beta-barrel protein [Rhodanobacteraceae bacterium]
MKISRRFSSFAASFNVLAFALACSLAHADSGVGVDTWHANKLDPTAGAAQQDVDDRGTSWLTPDQHRSPTGNLYMCPAEPPEVSDHGEWQSYGVLEIGLVATGGDDDNALWNRYVDWDSGLILGLLDYTWERPDDGTYANVRASRLSDDDEYYQAVFGRAGSYKVQAFLREMPNVLTNTARPIWNGVGSNNLTLPASLTPGGSTPAEVAAVSAATPERTLSVKRDKQGLGFSMFLTPEWTAYANVTDEERKGARPYGGTFYFNFPFQDNGGVLETVKPIDDSTLGINGGFRYAGSVWRMDFGYEGSFYRDRYRSYTFQSPFALTPIVPGATSAPLFQGQMSTEPDNDYNNLHATFTRLLPMNGEFSLTASGGRMSQDDALIAPIDCQGVFGIDLNGTGLGPQNPNLFDCSKWNTPAALSRTHADLSIDTTLVDGRIVLQPTSDLSVRGGLRFDREDYRNGYLAYNPLTGQYGYINENGAQGSIVPGEVGLWDPLTLASAYTQVRSIPLDMQTIDGNVGVDWKVGAHDTLGATYTYSRYEPSHRERSEVDDNSIKLTWVDRALDWLTFRANYTYLRQTGDTYNYDPYEFAFSSSMPGFVTPEGGLLPFTVDALRKYDLADRDENKVDLMATFMPREDMTLSTSLRGDWNDYDAVLGRKKYDTLGAMVQWEWQPSPLTSVSVFYGYDESTLEMANVNDLEFGSDPTFGGQTYPADGFWSARDKEKNHNAGATLTQWFGHVRFDAGWNYIYSRGVTNYAFASPTALAYFSDGLLPENAFPPMTYHVSGLTLGVTIPIVSRISLRLFDYYERGHIDDWHYSGFANGQVIDHRVYTDGGPQSYSANLVGLLLNIEL